MSAAFVFMFAVWGFMKDTIIENTINHNKNLDKRKKICIFASECFLTIGNV